MLMRNKAIVSQPCQLSAYQPTVGVWGHMDSPGGVWPLGTNEDSPLALQELVRGASPWPGLAPQAQVQRGFEPRPPVKLVRAPR